MTHPTAAKTESEAWCEDIHSALKDFSVVSELAGEKLVPGELIVESLPAPHEYPRRWPKGKMAIYGFWLNGEWLKIGQVSPNSRERYIYQHYNKDSSGSNLAKSIANDPSMQGDILCLDKAELREWIKRETSRVNILMPSTMSRGLRLLLEAFLHVRLRPRYEGSSRSERKRSD